MSHIPSKLKILVLLVCIGSSSLWFATALLSQADLVIFMPAIVAPEANTTQMITYEEDFTPFANPERGLFDQNGPLWLGEDMWVQDMSGLREDNVTMIRLYFVIDEFIDSSISDNALFIINANFEAARDAGIKVIPRFGYNFPGADYQNAQDADLETILMHIEQLKPILRSNSDVIAFMNLGFVGAWGEWHTSSNNHVNDENGRQINSNSEDIVVNLFTALPANRMATMRYPLYKQQFYGDDPLTTEEAFSGAPKARMGALNDCFLASNTDFGTYWPNESDSDIEAYKAYLSADNLYVPMSGETCNNDEQAQPYIGCENALEELEQMRWDALHRDYLVDVLDGWRQEGCFDEIQARLGYRFVLTEGTFPTEARRGETISIFLSLRNDGFGKAYNPRGFELILRNQTTEQEFAIALDEDPRFWRPGESFNLDIEVMLPAEMPQGNYSLFLNLPDPELTLKNNPDYSIRFANTDVWESSSGYNSLGTSITISNNEN